MAYPSWNVNYGYRTPIAAETVGGIDLAKTSALYIGLPINDRPSIDPGLEFQTDFPARAKPYRHSEDFNMRGKRPTFNFSCPATSYYLADFMYSLFMGIDSEAAGTPFKKIWTIPTSHREVVSGATEGTISALFAPHVLDFVRANPGLSGGGTDLDEVLIDGVVMSVALSFEGVLMMNVTVAGFDCDVSASDFSGTITNGWNSATGMNFCNALYWEVGTTVIPVQTFTLTLDPASVSFPYQKATPHTIALAPGAWRNTKLSLGVPLDKAAINDLFSNMDPSAVPFVAGGGLTGTTTRFKVYGPVSTSEGGTATNDIDFDGYWQIMSATTAGDDQQITTLECELAWDGSNAPLTVSIADGTDRAWS